MCWCWNWCSCCDFCVEIKDITQESEELILVVSMVVPFFWTKIAVAVAVASEDDGKRVSWSERKLT